MHAAMTEDNANAYEWAYLVVFHGMGFEHEERLAWNSGIVFW